MSQIWKTQPWNKEVLLECALFVTRNIFILDFGTLHVCHLVTIHVLILVSVSSAGGLEMSVHAVYARIIWKSILLIYVSVSS